MNKLGEPNYKLALFIVFSLTIIVYFSLTIQSSVHNWDQIQRLDKKNAYLEIKNNESQLQLTLLGYKMLHFTGQMKQLALFEADSLQKRIEIVENILCDIENFIENYGIIPK